MSNDHKKADALVAEIMKTKAPDTVAECLDAAAQLVAIENADLAMVMVEMAKVVAQLPPVPILHEPRSECMFLFTDDSAPDYEDRYVLFESFDDCLALAVARGFNASSPLPVPKDAPPQGCASTYSHMNVSMMMMTIPVRR